MNSIQPKAMDNITYSKPFKKLGWVHISPYLSKKVRPLGRKKKSIARRRSWPSSFILNNISHAQKSAEYF